MVRYTYAIAMARQKQIASSTNGNGHKSQTYDMQPSVLGNGARPTASEISGELEGRTTDTTTLLKNTSHASAVRNGSSARDANELLPVRQPKMDTATPEAVLGTERTEREMAMEMEIREVDLHRGENCEEWFLGGVNPKGQVSGSLSFASETNRLNIRFPICDVGKDSYSSFLYYRIGQCTQIIYAKSRQR